MAEVTPEALARMAKRAGELEAHIKKTWGTDEEARKWWPEAVQHAADIRALLAEREELKPCADEMLRITRAVGEGDDWGAVWETIFPALGLHPGEGELHEDDDA